MAYKTKEQQAAYHKEYYKRNREKILQQKKEYVANNQEKVKATKRRYYNENAERCKEYRRKYYVENREEILSKMRVRYTSPQPVIKSNPKTKNKVIPKQSSGTHVCPCCNIEKPFSEYHKNKGRKNNISTYCKICAINKSNKSRERRRRQRENIKEMSVVHCSPEEYAGSPYNKVHTFPEEHAVKFI